MTPCPNCQAILDAEAGRHPWAVARLAAGYVWLNQCQHYPGATFYVAGRCVAELHELPDDERRAHLMEMAAVAAAVHEEFGARKMNYEALGNTVAHLHWWLTPRPHDDRQPTRPIWEDDDFLRAMRTGEATPGAADARQLRLRLLQALHRHGVSIEAELVP
jgi:diadenosine tetraphosphate (Ap4A) HIT family hydrolase